MHQSSLEDDVWILFIQGNNEKRLYNASKRTFDAQFIFSNKLVQSVKKFELAASVFFMVRR